MDIARRAAACLCTAARAATSATWNRRKYIAYGSLPRTATPVSYVQSQESPVVAVCGAYPESLNVLCSRRTNVLRHSREHGSRPGGR
jgi:hypothetical protein